MRLPEIRPLCASRDSPAVQAGFLLAVRQSIKLLEAVEDGTRSTAWVRWTVVVRPKQAVVRFPLLKP